VPALWTSERTQERWQVQDGIVTIALPARMRRACRGAPVYDRGMSREASFSERFAALVERVVDGQGTAPAAVRAAAAGTGSAGLPESAAPVIDKIRRHASRVTDEDIASLRAAGLDEDTIYELTVAAALGVAQRRLTAALEAIDAVTAARAVA
jgi:hypothetical protein